MVNKTLYIIYGILFGAGMLYLGVHTVARISRNQALAECQASQNSNIAQDAQTRQEILNDIHKMPVTQRRQIMEQWVVE